MRVFAKNDNIFRVLSEAVSEGLLVVNSNKLIVATNRKADRMFGYRREELIGRSLNILIPDSYAKKHHKYVEDYFGTHKTRKMAVGRCLYGKRKNKEEFPAEVGLFPFTIYDATYVLALIFDKTEIKKRIFKFKNLMNI